MSIKIMISTFSHMEVAGSCKVKTNKGGEERRREILVNWIALRKGTDHLLRL